MVPLFIEVFSTMIIIEYYNMIIISCKTLLLYTLRFLHIQDVAIIHTVLVFTHTRRCYYTHSVIVHTYKMLLLYKLLVFTHARRCYYTPSAIVHTYKTLAVSDNFSIAHILHLLTGYDGHSTFIIPKVPTIFRGNAEDNSWYRGDI